MSVPGHRLDRMFNPKTIVVIGDKGPGYHWLTNDMPVKEQKGLNLYSVQVDPKEIEGIKKLGIQNFTALADVPGEVDYAVVAVPRQVAPLILRDLIAKKAHGASFFTSGFGETGEELGIKLQDTLTTMARAASFNLIGPNCMGLFVPNAGVRFNSDLPVNDGGNIGFISQSGTHAIMFTRVASLSGMSVGRAVSVGNAIALDIGDYLEYLALDDETEAIGMYIEGVRDGRRFFEMLKMACRRKPVVVWKGGQTEIGARATMSHTASLGSPQEIWEGMMRQCGAITTNNLEEMVDVMQLLVNTHRPRGPRMALLAQTGGQSVSMADAFAKAGLLVPRFTDDTYRQLAECVNVVGGSYQNPLDMAVSVQGNMETIDRILRVVDADPNVDTVVYELNPMVSARSWKADPAKLTETLDTIQVHRERSAKSFMVILSPGYDPELVASFTPRFHERKIPVFQSFERGAAAMARYVGFINQ